jgi:hypothetical protein
MGFAAGLAGLAAGAAWAPTANVNSNETATDRFDMTHPQAAVHRS